MPDTIFAQATVRGRSAVAIVRVSGPKAFEAAERLAGIVPAARRAVLRWLRDPASGERLDQAVVIGFRGPASFTGEDCVELQTHGSPAVVAGVLQALGQLEALRPAEPGEFTRRALLAGRMDLTQVEGLADLLAAETAVQRRQALDLVEGALSHMVADWRGALIRALAFLESTIDFVDEDLPEDLAERVSSDLRRISAEMDREIRGALIGERLRDGFEVALVGLPNVGKSTLLNCLARRNVALVSAEAGTTRDVLEVRLELAGLPVTVLDMAGLRDARGVEGAGVALARERAQGADLRVFLVDSASEVAGLGVAQREGDIVALAKADLRNGNGVSGLSGKGVDELLSQLAAVLVQRVGSGRSVTRARQRLAIEQALRGVGRASDLLVHGAESVELAAEEVRNAVRGLDFLVGRLDVEGVLDVVFSSFCLGK